MASNAKQLEAQTIEERKQFKELEDEYRIQKKIFTELLPDAENNIRMLQVRKGERLCLCSFLSEYCEEDSFLVLCSFRSYCVFLGGFTRYILRLLFQSFLCI